MSTPPIAAEADKIIPFAAGESPSPLHQPVSAEPAPSGWIGVDLDGCLAWHEPGGAFDETKTGEPVPLMLHRVRGWLAQGREVRVLTARANSEAGRAAVRAWLAAQGLEAVRITNCPDYEMIAWWSDCAVGVARNQGASHYEERRMMLNDLLGLALVAGGQELPRDTPFHAACAAVFGALADVEAEASGALDALRAINVKKLSAHDTARDGVRLALKNLSKLTGRLRLVRRAHEAAKGGEDEQ